MSPARGGKQRLSMFVSKPSIKNEDGDKPEKSEGGNSEETPEKKSCFNSKIRKRLSMFAEL